MYNFIWDLDGTLLDAYESIVISLKEALALYDLSYTEEQINREVIESSVTKFVKDICEENKISFDEFWNKFSKIRHKVEDENMTPMKNSIEVLEKLKNMGYKNYVFTHRDHTSYTFLDKFDMTKYFKEIISSQDGFERKPSGQALNYLVDKYDMDRETTFYIGDRILDLESAKDAEIKSIFFLEDDSVLEESILADFIINDLKDLLKIL